MVLSQPEQNLVTQTQGESIVIWPTWPQWLIGVCVFAIPVIFFAVVLPRWRDQHESKRAAFWRKSDRYTQQIRELVKADLNNFLSGLGGSMGIYNAHQRTLNLAPLLLRTYNGEPLVNYSLLGEVLSRLANECPHMEGVIAEQLSIHFDNGFGIFELPTELQQSIEKHHPTLVEKIYEEAERNALTD